MHCVIHVAIAVYVGTPIAVHVAFIEILESISVRNHAALVFSWFARI